jgi:hypothetical protein
MEFGTEEKIIASRLCEVESFPIYDLHLAYRLSLVQIVKATRALKTIGLIDFDDKSIWRSPAFFERLINFRHAIYNRTRPWRRARFRRVVDGKP